MNGFTLPFTWMAPRFSEGAGSALTHEVRQAWSQAERVCNINNILRIQRVARLRATHAGMKGFVNDYSTFVWHKPKGYNGTIWQVVRNAYAPKELFRLAEMWHARFTERQVA